MSFFVDVKGCVNFYEMTSVHKKRVSHAESFRKWERFLKTTASLSNLIPPCFYYLTNLVSVLMPRRLFMPRLLQYISGEEVSFSLCYSTVFTGA